MGVKEGLGKGGRGRCPNQGFSLVVLDQVAMVIWLWVESLHRLGFWDVVGLSNTLQCWLARCWLAKSASQFYWDAEKRCKPLGFATKIDS